MSRRKIETLDALFATDEKAAYEKALAEIKAEAADPAYRAAHAAKMAAAEAKVDAEIAAGLRDEDGNWIEDEDGLDPEFDDDQEDEVDDEGGAL